MPELPEVEFAASRLREWLVGRRIERGWAFEGTPLRGVTAEAFVAGLLGQRVSGIRRLGKQMFIDLDDVVWLAHLGMTGKFLRRTDEAEVRNGTRVQLWLDDGSRLDFVDPRRFGRLRLLQPGVEDPEVAKLGPDALGLRESGLLYSRLRTRRQIKVALLDQTVVAGVGNIYAAEALFRVGVSPRRRADRVGRGTADRLGHALVDVMLESLDRERDEEIRYLQDAEAQNPFVVYGREGEPCPGCGAAIRRFVQQGRSTFWCGRCQAR